MEISVSIDKFDASPDPQSGEVILKFQGTARVKAEDALLWARKVELAASDVIGASA